MVDLKSIGPLGKAEPFSQTIGTIQIMENPSYALASVACTAGKEATLQAAAVRTFGFSMPDVGQSARNENGDWGAFWTGPGQFMVEAPMDHHEDISAHLITTFQGVAAITEQTGGWIRFDVEGEDCIEWLHRLCAVDTGKLLAGSAVRTVIEHLGVFVICDAPQTRFRIYGASSSAHSLLHALTSAAHSIARG
ncbi:MAG: sarcosine oxidase subunit gamma [Pseudomonadota bacterium]